MPIKKLFVKILLFWNSMLFFARYGVKPNGVLSICKAYIDVAPCDYSIYEKMLQLQTKLLTIPEQPRIEVCFIQITDSAYREMQINFRASYKGVEAWYLYYIFINNFWGWIIGRLSYGYNKFLHPINFTFTDPTFPFIANVSSDQASFHAHFEKAILDHNPKLTTDGNYSILNKHLIYCSPSISSQEIISLDYGYITVATKDFEKAFKNTYAGYLASFVTDGTYKASLLKANVTNVSMASREFLKP